MLPSSLTKLVISADKFNKDAIYSAFNTIYLALQERLQHFPPLFSHKYLMKYILFYLLNFFNSTLLVAKQQNWPFDLPVMFKIFAHIADGWYNLQFTEISD